MAGNVKLMTSAGGGVVLDTATTTATDVTVKVPAVNGDVVLTNVAGTVALAATGANIITASTNGSERMRIDSSGNLLVGDSGSVVTTGAFRVKQTAASTYNSRFQSTDATTPVGISIMYSAAAPNGTGSQFIYCEDSSAQRMSVRSNGGIYNYSANNSNLSDRREKTDFAPAKEYLNIICNIPVQTFKYIDQTDNDSNLGVVAQDVQAVAPELVSESNWGSEEEPKMRLSIYQTDLQYALMKCIQELSAKNDALEARIATLEAK